VTPTAKANTSREDQIGSQRASTRHERMPRSQLLWYTIFRVVPFARVGSSGWAVRRRIGEAEAGQA
jgi:hypothetical protein